LPDGNPKSKRVGESSTKRKSAITKGEESDEQSTKKINSELIDRITQPEKFLKIIRSKYGEFEVDKEVYRKKI